MSFVTQVTRSLFPTETPRRARRHPRGGSLLAQVMALSCALVPFAAVTHAYISTY